MKFNWTDMEKEYFYRKAARQLKAHEIDFLAVDHSQFGVKGWDAKRGVIEAAVVSLTPYPYRSLKASQKKQLAKMANWECIDKKPSARDRIEGQIFMHSRLLISA
ncbi:hypothetical protein [Sporofaciens musculi]|uniref:hypothetical protein n=1 Tax=Sporofaciens musculi TaxID=2681861 RepID=UPI00259C913D|nr:hypothetical protein [Sporofaciens musculi]